MCPFFKSLYFSTFQKILQSNFAAKSVFWMFKVTAKRVRWQIKEKVNQRSRKWVWVWPWSLLVFHLVSQIIQGENYFVIKPPEYLSLPFILGTICGSAERRLLEDLMNYYQKLERPVANESEAVQLKFGLTLQQIMDVVGIRIMHCSSLRYICRMRRTKGWWQLFG